MMQNNFTFVLVRPEFLGNIGSVARVMKNFGFSNLRLVGAPRNYLDAEARKMSVGAFDVLKNAQTFDGLAESLKDINLAIGTTSGHQRQEPPEELEALSAKFVDLAQQNKIAFVLGNERDGLTRDELARCHRIIRVLTAPEFPSLNLSQAVGIICYELMRTQKTGRIGQDPCLTLSTGSLDDELMTLLDEVLHDAGFTRTYNRDNVVTQLRRFYQRAHPSSREAELLKGALLRIKQRLAGPT